MRLLPIVAREESFALKGGTAINLFVRELPRLSVDIDLVVAFRWARLIEEPDGGFREKEFGVDKEDGIQLILAGSIPSADVINIESVGKGAGLVMPFCDTAAM